MKTLTGGLSYRKQYALQCILKGINSRARDNCYEAGDGDEVVRYIMKRATEILPDATLAYEKWKTHGISVNDPEYRLIKKHELQKTLVANLKNSGVYDQWKRLMNE